MHPSRGGSDVALGASIPNAFGDVNEELGKEIVPFLVPLKEHVSGAIHRFAALSP